jgi:hypothetical protein
VPFLELALHHFDRDHGVVDQQAERDDEGAQRVLCRSMPIRNMTRNLAANTSGIVKATTRPARQPARGRTR